MCACAHCQLTTRENSALTELPNQQQFAAGRLEATNWSHEAPIAVKDVRERHHGLGDEVKKEHSGPRQLRHPRPRQRNKFSKCECMEICLIVQYLLYNYFSVIPLHKCIET